MAHIPQFPLDVAAYPRICRPLLEPARLPPLGPGIPNRDVYPLLESLTTVSLGQAQSDAARLGLQCCLAALWLRHDFLSESHRLSQDINTPDGSYWHGIMHRREPDFSNAKYWFRRVGNHPVFEPLLKVARQIAHEEAVTHGADPAWSSGTRMLDEPNWDPLRFVDMCRAAYEGQAALEMLARRIAQAEWDLLFAHCYHSSVFV